jgi:arabinan endo-1,5-alpha-L-arabinosidase
MFPRVLTPLTSVILLFTPAYAGEPVGRRDLRVHDPSTLVRTADGVWWLFATGRQIISARSTDLQNWTYHDPVLTEPPKWALEVAPGNTKHHYWAPDVIKLGGLYHLYYSVSEFGKNTSAIALATSPTLDPGAVGYGWKDRGIVIRSGVGNDYNAIDPALLHDAGRLWMAFGSFWGGIFLVELDPSTGLLLAPDAEPKQLAWSKEIEAPTLHRRGDYFYLFVNQGLCCRGKDSTYRLLVGRSRVITGPYVDDAGKDLREGGGRFLLGSSGDFIGPGHIGLLLDGEKGLASMHFYDGSKNGTPTLALRGLSWTDDDWPEIRD